MSSFSSTELTTSEWWTDLYDSNPEVESATGNRHHSGSAPVAAEVTIPMLSPENLDLDNQFTLTPAAENNFYNTVPIPMGSVQNNLQYQLNWSFVAQNPFDSAPTTPTPAKKRWTKDEHMLFLIGLDVFGEGYWKSIATKVVVTRTPTQVASHAQKYFLHHRGPKQNGKRWSIHDITTVDPESMAWLIRKFPMILLPLLPSIRNFPF